MNTRTILASALVAMLALVSATATELPLKHLPDKAALVADLDAKTFRESEAGEVLDKQFESMKGQLMNGPLAQVNLMSFDSKDVDRTIVAVTGTDKPTVIVYVYGKLDQAKLDKFAEESAKQSGEPVGKSLLGNRSVSTWKAAQQNAQAQAANGDANAAPAQTVNACIAEDGLVVFTDTLDNLQLALDVIDGKAPSLSKMSTVARLADPVSMFAWLGLYIDGESDLVKTIPNNNQQMQQIRALRLVFSGEMRNVTLKLDGRFDSAANAAQAQQGLMMLPTLVTMQGNNGGNVDPLVSKILGNLTVTSEGEWVCAETKVPADELAKKLGELAAQIPADMGE